MRNVERFLNIYKENLRLARGMNPGDYAWPESEFDAVFGRMSKAILRGSFNKDSYAIKNTCKDLGIKHTYTAIREFIGEVET